MKSLHPQIRVRVRIRIRIRLMIRVRIRIRIRIRVISLYILESRNSKRLRAHVTPRNSLEVTDEKTPPNHSKEETENIDVIRNSITERIQFKFEIDTWGHLAAAKQEIEEKFPTSYVPY